MGHFLFLVHTKYSFYRCTGYLSIVRIVFFLVSFTMPFFFFFGFAADRCSRTSCACMRRRVSTSPFPPRCTRAPVSGCSRESATASCLCEFPVACRSLIPDIRHRCAFVGRDYLQYFAILWSALVAVDVNVNGNITEGYML